MAQTESRPSKPEPMFSVIIGVTRAVLRNRVKPSTRSVPACGTDRRLFVWERIRDPAHEIWSFGFNTLPFVSWYKAGAFQATFATSRYIGKRPESLPGV